MDLEASLNGGFQPKRYRPGGVGNWSGHLPFARDLTVAAKPSLFVELGTHYGESYFGFCQAVRENNIACSCYAIDTWVGEPQAGFYGETVFNDVDAYNSANYSDFSYLLRTTFDEAIAKFADESVDLLHLDGLHTYQAVSHDLRSWLKKVKPGGIVLIHDVMVRHADFGVWKLWDELASSGEHFVFRHSWGLGVFRKPGSAEPGNGLLKILFDSSPEIGEHARKFYALCATKLQHEHEGERHHYAPEGKIVAHLYPFGNTGYTAETAIKVDIKPGEWQHLSIDLVQGAGNGPLRLDPAEQPGLVDVSAIVLRRPADGHIIWSVKGPGELAALSAGGTLVRVDKSESRDFCRFFSYGSDPQLLLPIPDRERFDQPLLLEIWLRIQTDMASLLPVLQDADQQRSHVQVLESALESALEETRSAAADQKLVSGERHSLTQELNALVHGRDALVEERKTLLEERKTLVEEGRALLDEQNTLVEERNSLLEERHATARKQEALLADFRKLQSDLYVCRTDLKRKTAEEEQLRSHLAASQHVLQSALASRSWRITAPIRKLLESSRGQR